ncbi:MAG: hypothetical protein SF162_16355 [bacterium]|nr:hypothetical protein [bacterium]
MNTRSFGRAWHGLALILIVLIVSGCGGLDNMSGRSVGSGDHAVTVTNSTGTRICYLFVSPATQDSWGEDYLGETGVLDNGGTITVRVAASGTYDLMAVTQAADGNCDDTGVQITNMGVEIEGETTWTITQ